MTIRLATPADLKNFYSLFREFQDHHYQARKDIFRNPKQVNIDRESFAILLRDPKRALFVADNGSLAGMLLITIIPIDVGELQVERTLPTIEMIYVRPKYRRNQVAKALTQAAYAWSKEKGFKEVVLDIWGFSEGAIEFFGKEGFSIRTIRLIKKLES